MADRFDLDGDSWEIGVEEHGPRPGTRAIVFHCVTNPQRPYRVVEIGADEYAEGDSIDKHRAAAWFDRSQVMDFSHDPEATPDQPPPTQ